MSLVVGSASGGGMYEVIERLRRIEEKLDRMQYRGQFSGYTRAQPVTDDSAKNLALTRPESADVLDIFNYWCTRLQKNGNVKLTAERRRCIKARLKDGYSVEEIKRAIDGCASSEFHTARGQYRGQRRYDDLTLILRNGSRLEGFRDYADGTRSTTDMSKFL